MTSSQRRCRAIALSACFVALWAPAARANDSSYFVVDDLTFGARTITFDTDTNGNPVAATPLFESSKPLRDLYGAWGVHFRGPREGDGGCVLSKDSAFQVAPYSGTNFLAFNRETTAQGGGIAQEPETILFDVPPTEVSLRAASGFQPGSFRLDAYDRSGHVVASDSTVTQDWALLKVTSPGGIARVVLSRKGPRGKAAVTVTSATAAPGDAVAVQLQVDAGGKSLGGFHAALQMGPALTPEGADPVALGPMLAGGYLAANAPEPGSVTFSAVASVPRDGPGVLVSVVVRVPPGTAAGDYPLTLADVQLNDAAGDPITVETADGTLQVVAPPPPTGLCGDLSGDGKVNIVDVIQALRLVAGFTAPTDQQRNAACGYKLDISLVVRLLRVAVGLSGPLQPKGA